jgi:uncharacterized protein YkwD
MRRLVLLSTLSVAALLALAAPASADGPWDRLLAPQGSCGAQTDRGGSVRAQERAMRCLVNFARRAEGLAPLRKRGSRLSKAADRKAADILRCGEFSHTACGRPFTFHIKATSYAAGCYGAGENIAWGSGHLGTVRSIMSGWLNSDGHRANLLNARYRDHGVALRTGRLSGYDGAAVWVHQLGYRC